MIMEVKISTICFHLSQPLLSPSSKRRDGGSLVCRSTFFGPSTTKLHRSRSSDVSKPITRTIRRSCSAILNAFSDDEFSKKMQELALRLQPSDEIDNRCSSGIGSSAESDDFADPFWLETNHEPPDWPSSIEWKANSFDLPVSLRIIQKKMQCQDDVISESTESVDCSVKRAFSSVVFMIRELHSYSLRLRELLFFEDLQSILIHVQKEIHASFVWLFQQVFSHTPTLMVYVMILLANFTVYSMGNNAAIASSPPPTVASVSVVEFRDQQHPMFDSSTVKTFSVNGKTISIGGNNGSGGKVRPVAGGVDDDGQFNQSDQYGTILPDTATQVPSVRTTSEAETVTGETEKTGEEEEGKGLWELVVEDARGMQEWRNEDIDDETMKKFVSPVSAKIESEDDTEYLRTELVYQSGILQEPNNPLLLTNYAQFLYLVAHDNDRAEEYFKRAVAVEPPDAEAYSQYATFLWQAKNDLWAAEEAYLEAISADPHNAYHSAKYANFLWNTGGEDTCYPLDTA